MCMVKNIRLLASLFSVILLAVVATGCDTDEDDFYSPVMGDWVLVEDNYGPVIREYDRVYFELEPSGRGIYGYYDDRRRVTVPIDWEVDDDRLYIYVWRETWTYRWFVSGSRLMLMSLDGDGSRLVFEAY